MEREDEFQITFFITVKRVDNYKIEKSKQGMYPIEERGESPQQHEHCTVSFTITPATCTECI